jgi:chromosomal replication initiation ATPase DnaA
MYSDVPVTNLITLFGTNGSGKTQSLKAIEQQLRSDQVIRIGVETLVDEVVTGVRNRLPIEELLKHYREIDTLLIDNLWVLASRPHVSKTIRELVEARIANAMLTVLSSDLNFYQWSARQPEMTSLLSRGTMVQLS